ncbi:MAG: DUF1028 domain-containing protein [Planctomycetota bacterium]|jgi:uncharacterized Ntn-hydrolase superfamily protein
MPRRAQPSQSQPFPTPLGASFRFTLLALLGLLLGGASPLGATWSIVICDVRTKEVSVASVTCLNNFDLQAITPVVVVGRGAGACQAAGDFDGVRRPIMRNALVAGTPLSTMMIQLAQVPGHAQRQYGVVDTRGGQVTFTGGQAFAWAGGVVGTDGDLRYAIQGNILTGACVVAAAEDALLATVGDVPTKLMAAMQAAKDAGGDGRCSCSSSAATSCGCPPVTFTKSGHIGYLLVARAGDSNDPICNFGGCADGDYLYSLNVPFQAASAPDPVDQLQALFDQRRGELAGRPDAVRSLLTVTPVGDDRLYTIEWRDQDDGPVTVPFTVEVIHAQESAGASGIGPVIDLGGGVTEVLVEAGAVSGLDRLRIIADDGFRPVELMPGPGLEFCAGSLLAGAPDCNGNGVPDGCDIDLEDSDDLDQDGIPDECPLFSRGDCNGDGTVNFTDVTTALDHLFRLDGPDVPCREACNIGGGDRLDLADPIWMLNYFFGLGAPPPAPFPGCGSDTDPAVVDCVMGTCDQP